MLVGLLSGAEKGGNPNRGSEASAKVLVGVAEGDADSGGGAWRADHQNHPRRPSPAVASNGDGGLKEGRDSLHRPGGGGGSPANVPAAASPASPDSLADYRRTGPCASEAEAVAGGRGGGDAATGAAEATALPGSCRPALRRCPSTTGLWTRGTPPLMQKMSTEEKKISGREKKERKMLMKEHATEYLVDSLKKIYKNVSFTSFIGFVWID